jgi:hypothetical protein
MTSPVRQSDFPVVDADKNGANTAIDAVLAAPLEITSTVEQHAKAVHVGVPSECRPFPIGIDPGHIFDCNSSMYSPVKKRLRRSTG